MAMAHAATRGPIPRGIDFIAPSRRSVSIGPQDRRVEIAAAKPRITPTNSCEVSPDWITAFARGKSE